MLKIFNNLEPFFEDVYREFSVREYGRLRKISPPTASKILKGLATGSLLISKKQGIYLVFRANNECHLFKDLAVAYWREKLFHLLEGIHKEVLFKSVILFGSIAKAENTKDSDVDLYIDMAPKQIDTKHIETKLKRKMQIHFRDSSKNENLLENIKKGIKIR
ncbi:nucleotidyltransferase domain-containing protein [Candidatus Woesearchaeota archaeon]|nr:nucleotidyltransferase domain-containing protein [Candidatus Woesearchaeota archaeon]